MLPPLRNLALPVSLRRSLLLAALLGTGCAVVDSIASGFRAVGRWAEGVDRAEGQVLDGEQEGEWTFTTNAGELRARGAYVDDVQDGPWTYWYPNGHKEYEGTFAHEQRVGLWRYWHKSGNLRAQGHFLQGREFGEWTFWSSRGALSQRGPFWNGLQTGRWTYWSEDGSKQAEGLFLEGERVGEWLFWDAQGAQSRTSYELPDAHRYVVDHWEDGSDRREGFLVDERREGLWLLRHPDGALRMVGIFEEGTAQGPWVAFRADGERLAAGEVELGRPSGEWEVWDSGVAGSWSANGASPPPPFLGEWSASELADEAEAETVVGVWLAESLAPLPANTELALAPEEEEVALPEALPEQLAAVEEQPEVPLYVQPWTQRELDEYQDYVRAYDDGGLSPRLASRYGGGAPRQDGTPSLATGGDVERSREFLGKPLPLTVFKDQTGADVELDSLRGHKVILVVLRGFGGGVCVYCTAQTRAFCSAGAFERFENLGAKLQVVFPGPANGLEAFKRGYASLNEEELPPYGLLYENDYIVSRMMKLEGNKVLPSTFLLDEEGVVRFAYVGQHEADRPSVDLIVEALQRMEAE